MDRTASDRSPHPVRNLDRDTASDTGDSASDTRRAFASAPHVDAPSELVDRFPSLAYYPSISPALRDALQSRASPPTVLGALADAVAPHRWPSSEDWDRAGFIDVAAASPGFVTRIAGGSISAPTGRHDLGCAGGFLEGVRAVVAPRVDVADLERCDAQTFAIAGAPTRCDGDHDFGLLAIANIAAVLEPARLPAGPTIHTWSPTPGTHAKLARDGALHLCTLSHEAAGRGGERFHHHMMIAGGDADGLWIFDTTGVRGVALQRMDTRRFIRYFTSLLAVNRDYRYVATSARLSCLEVSALP